MLKEGGWVLARVSLTAPSPTSGNRTYRGQLLPRGRKGGWMVAALKETRAGISVNAFRGLEVGI